jgi:FkbH-like protein
MCASPKPVAPADELLALHRSGLLAARYPRVRELIADLCDDELLRAGRLLSRIDPDDVLREHPATAALTVAVTGHGSLSQLVPPLTAELARHGVLLRPLVSDFDSYVSDLFEPTSAVYAAGADLVLCVLDPMIVFDEVPCPWRPRDVERVIEDKLRLLERLTTQFDATGQGILVLNTMPLPRNIAAQLVDHRSRARLGAVWREANARLLRLVDRHDLLVVLDLDPLIAEGIASRDARLSVYAKAHLSPDLLAAYGREVAHLARAVRGDHKKCLALDLDGTVWGGVLGEDGIDGIEVADCYRGQAFSGFQSVVKQIGSQGVLLAAVSKNDSEPVEQVLRDHPGMTLRSDDFVRVIANWRPKSENLSALAAELTLGVDSVVFVDDSAAECGLVRGELPNVAVIHLADEPALHVDKLLRDGWFSVLELTNADRSRPSEYRDALAREDFPRRSDSLAEYLRELDIHVRLSVVDEAEVSRISQLTLRTNQFNLTTERLQPGQVRALVANPTVSMFGIHASDRFGDNGLVGAIVMRWHRTAGHIDNFLLSCRMFGRGIEHACLASVLRHARARGTSAVFGAYRQTAKNGKVRDFYPRGGFVPVADERTTVIFRHDLAEIAPPPEHITLTGLRSAS